MQTRVQSWYWRKAQGGWTVNDHDSGPRGRAFHAYDVNDNAACKPTMGLAASCEEPNEGSHFCPDCIKVVQKTPKGREKRVFLKA